MSLRASNVEKDYLNALGYKNPKSISKLNRKLIKQLIENDVPADVIEKSATKNNYVNMTNDRKGNFITKFITYYIEKSRIREAEIITDDEDEFVDAKERIIKPKHNQQLNISQTKMSSAERMAKIKAGKQKAFGYMNYKPYTGKLTPKEEEAMFGENYKHVFNDDKHPYWNRKVSYDPKLENPNYAAYMADKIGGKAYRDDFNDDGVEDIVITTKTGKVKYINGHSEHQSTRGKDLPFYDSLAYQKASHKTAKGSLDVLSKNVRRKYEETMSNKDKLEADKILRAAGFSCYMAKPKTLNRILKESAGELYKNVIEAIVAKHEVDKKKLKQQLSMSRFETLIVNAILLKLYKADLKQSKSSLDQLVADLKKAWDKSKDKSAIINFANNAIDVLSKPEILDDLAVPLYNITLKDSKHGEVYEGLIKLIGDGIKIDDKYKKYYDEKIDSYEDARNVKRKAYMEKYYAKNPDKKPKSKKGSKKEKEIEPLDTDFEE